MNDERRKYSRVKYDARVFVEVDGEDIEGHLTDVSLKGALLTWDTPRLFDPEPHYKMTMVMGETPVELRFELIVRAAFQKDDQTGFKFINMSLDCLTHLRRVVELQTADPDKIKEELFFLANAN